jgi:phosphatidylethanolamine-binding protein (PEBP) family uncharacterized protein
MSRNTPRKRNIKIKTKRKTQKRRRINKKRRGGQNYVFQVKYNSNIVNGQYLTKEETSYPPELIYNQLDDNSEYTLIMYDPDAPLHPAYLHWIKTDITSVNQNGVEIIPYTRPKPPPNTGRINNTSGKRYHEYIFILIKNKNKNINGIKERTNFDIGNFVNMYGEEVRRVSFRVVI